jgi:arginine repressor
MNSLYFKAALYKSLLELKKATVEDIAAYLLAKGIEATPQKISQYLIKMPGVKYKRLSYKTIYFLEESNA